jgi:predicted enzyme related to lactoylglutathione lyase
MTRRLVCFAAVAAALFVTPAQAQQSTSQGARMSVSPKPAPVMFFDLAGEQSTKLSGFYSSIFGWTVAPDGRFTAHVVSPPLVARSDYQLAYGTYSATISAPLGGQIRPDPSEKRVYLGVPDVAATLNAIKAQGGTIEAPRFEVPGVVVLGLFKDPGGNAMGLIELDGDRVRIP